MNSDPNRFNDSLQEARQRAIEIQREAQERAAFLLRETREAQERARVLARRRAQETQEILRRAAEAVPPGLIVRLTSSMIGIPILLGLVFWEGPPQYAALPFTVACAICAVVGGNIFAGCACAASAPARERRTPRSFCFSSRSGVSASSMSRRFCPPSSRFS